MEKTRHWGRKAEPGSCVTSILTHEGSRSAWEVNAQVAYRSMKLDPSESVNVVREALICETHP